MLYKEIVWHLSLNISYIIKVKASDLYFSWQFLAVQGGPILYGFLVCGWVWPFKWKLSTEQYFPVVLFILCCIRGPTKVNSDKRHDPKSSNRA